MRSRTFSFTDHKLHPSMTRKFYKSDREEDGKSEKGDDLVSDVGWEEVYEQEV